MGALALVPALVAAVVFANTLQNGFVYDDSTKISTLPQRLPFLGDLVQLRGITYVSQLLDRWYWGDWAPGFHLTNVLLHSLASALAAYAAFVLCRSRRIALLTGLFFAVHPVHVEAVASFANRKDVLAMIFVALALILWRNERFPVLGYAAALVSYALGFLSKEVAALALAPMLFLADLLFDPRSPSLWPERLRRATLRILPLFLAGLAVTIRLLGDLSRFFTPESIYRATEGRLHEYPQVLTNVAAAVPDLLRLLFWPAALSADYPLWPEITWTHPRVVLGLTLVLLWTVASGILLRRAPLAGFAMVWTLVTYLPASNLLPLIHFFVAERYLYVPSFGVCLLVAFFMDRMLRSAAASSQKQFRHAAVGLAVALIASGAARCVVRNRDWHDGHALWSSAFGAGYETRRVHVNLGYSFLERRDFHRAIDHFQKSLKRVPEDLATRRAMIGSLVLAGRLDEAEVECRKILATRPEDVESYYTLAEVELRRGNRDWALRFYEWVLAEDPDHVGALIDLARLRAAAPEAYLRDGSEALRLSERARQLTLGTNTDALLALAASHAALGDLGKAVEWSREAYRVAQAQGRTKLAVEIAVYAEKNFGAAWKEVP